jgi:protein phosphatase
MGGHEAGEVASLEAVQAIGKHLTLAKIQPLSGQRQLIETALIEAVLAAHQHIRQISNDRPQSCRMGTTVVMALIQDRILYTCHVGDSRAYVIRESGMYQITEDHSEVSLAVRQGIITRAEARVSPLKNHIIQALGTTPEIYPEVNEFLLEAGDLVLLCSDGLWDMLTDDEIFQIISASNTLPEAGQQLIAAANEAGGKDNITLILAGVI